MSNNESREKFEIDPYFKPMADEDDIFRRIGIGYSVIKTTGYLLILYLYPM